MLKFKLRELSQKLKKSISQISKETHLNRNTITALYHNKVNGIQFSTLEKICDTYKIKIEDLLELKKPSRPEEKTFTPYRQEGSLIPFTCWPWMTYTNNLPKKYFDYSLGKIQCFYKEKYGYAYFDLHALNQCAESIYQKYENPQKLNELYENYLKHSNVLKDFYFENDPQDLFQFNNKELIAFFKKLWKIYEKFWMLGMFIDSFDPGTDQKKIKLISQKYNLNPEETIILSTPIELTFNNERLFSILKITKNLKTKLKNKKVKPAEIKLFLKNFVTTNAKIKEYRKEFDYYQTNYADLKHIENQQIISEILKYLKNPELFKKQLTELSRYSRKQKSQIQKILKKHSLPENPLYFFQKLTFWREHRKKINLMGMQFNHTLLKVLEERTGIKKDYLGYLVFDEVENVLKGSIDHEALRKRHEEGIFIFMNNLEYKMVTGDEAVSLKDELEKQLTGETLEEKIPGQTACSGYAKGVARVILSQEDFSKLKEGEILVTGMTRPEFLPVMKKASAFITNEGGITCHAAIVAREMGKPCVIGTKNATQLIKDGDLVEVRGNHGTVRILDHSS
jgi:phosphoenolpyruvate synthase/pyruvate phosphate dikinase/DNA-binding Xre family transcriptional regulator